MRQPIAVPFCYLFQQIQRTPGPRGSFLAASGRLLSKPPRQQSQQHQRDRKDDPADQWSNGPHQ